MRDSSPLIRSTPAGVGDDARGSESAGTEWMGPENRCMYSKSRRPGVRGRRATNGPSLVVDQSFQRCIDGRVVGEFVQTPASGAELTGRLTTTQQQQADHRELGFGQLQLRKRRIAQPLRVFDDPTFEVLFAADEVFVLELPRGVLHGSLIERQHRIAARFLIARERQRIQRQRILFRRHDRLLHQRTDDARFVQVEDDVQRRGPQLESCGSVGKPDLAVCARRRASIARSPMRIAP